MNYFVINRPSNLITGVIASSSEPVDTKVYRFVPANDKALTLYYNLLNKNPDIFPDVGEILAKSTYTLEWMKSKIPFSDEGRSTPQKIRYREPEPVFESQEVPPLSRRIDNSSQDRESSIYSWLSANPDADPYDLNDRLYGYGCSKSLF